eukprot:m51a1_g13321 hypothetical protein (388) ;mRNA; f:127-1413
MPSRATPEWLLGPAASGGGLRVSEMAPWSGPVEKSLTDLMFSTEERMENLQLGSRGHTRPGMGMRESLAVMARNYDARRALCRYLIQDAEQSAALAVDVHSAREAAPGLPLLDVSINFMRRTDDAVPLFAALLSQTAPREGVYSWTVPLDEVLFTRDVLAANARRLSPLEQSTLAARASMPPQYAEFFTASFALPVCAPPPSHLVAKAAATATAPPTPCATCGKPARNVCSRCKAVSYCGRECQKADWPQHKATCGTRGSDAGSVLVPFADDATRGMYGAMLGVGQHTSGSITGAKLKVPANTHGDREFVVKVQVPLTGGDDPLLVYDQTRAWQVFLQCEGSPAEYRALQAAVRDTPLRIKAFFRAKREGHFLRVFTTDLPSQNQRW